jgi:hypothetical protein
MDGNLCLKYSIVTDIPRTRPGVSGHPGSFPTLSPCRPSDSTVEAEMMSSRALYPDVREQGW